MTDSENHPLSSYMDIKRVEITAEAQAAVTGIARYVWLFYDALIENGFDRADALDLTKFWMARTTGNSNDRTEGE